jgi:predicted nucleic acid-binding protein
VRRRSRIRLFLDSNVLTAGIISPWGLDNAIVSLCSSRFCELVLAEVVKEEVEENLLLHAERAPSLKSEELLERYLEIIELTHPDIVPYPSEHLVRSSRYLIRHEADVPVLLSAIAGMPDWLLTHNTKHFTQAVAKRTGLRIASPRAFFSTLSRFLG